MWSSHSFVKGWVFAVRFPLERIGADIGADTVHVGIGAEDVFVIIALPEAAFKRRPVQPVHAEDIFVGADRFEHPDDLSQCWSGGGVGIGRGGACPRPDDICANRIRFVIGTGTRGGIGTRTGTGTHEGCPIGVKVRLYKKGSLRQDRG